MGRVTIAKVTMNEVARAAGVSQSSVSNAYNRPNKLSEEQRAHIFAVAKELGYAGPNPMARSLRTGRAGAWGLVLNEKLAFAFDDPTMLLLLRGISNVCDELNVSLTLLPVPGSSMSSPDILQQKTQLIRDAHVDGFLAYFMPEDSPALEIIRARGTPLVTIDSPRLDWAGFVGIDDYAAAQLSARHILEMGHRRIVIFADRLSVDPYMGFVSEARLASATDAIARDRVNGFLDTFREAGLGEQDIQVFEAGGYLAGVARAAAGELLDTSDCTAIVACSDTLAFAAITEINGRGLSVPEDISIIGFDGVPDSAKQHLTTVRQPLVRKGTSAAEMLARILAGRDVDHDVMSVQLIERGSVKRP